MKKNFSSFLSIMLMVLLLIYPQKVSDAVVNSVKSCAFTIIPALFPFAVASNLLILGNTFSSEGLGAKVFSKIFNCPSYMFPIFLSGIAGGYPIGAISAAEMYKTGQCSKSDAQKVLSFCCLCGPSFIISAVGSAMLGNIRCGIFLYFCHLISALITGIILRPFFKKGADFKAKVIKESVSFSDCLASALKNSAASMISVCSCVIFFSTINSILAAIKLDSPYTTAILEMTTGAKALIASNIPSVLLLPSLSFCIAFGGISVHIQVFSVCGQSDINTMPFFIGKIIHAVLCFFSTLLLQNMLGSASVFLPNQDTVYQTPYIYIPVLLTFFIFVLKKCGNKFRIKL